MYKRINDYGIIGNLGSCALVGLDGSIDWCCLPHIDSSSVFCALLDDNKGGRFRIGARGEYQSTQTYQKDTNILDTIITTPSGKVTITDFMPFSDAEEEQGRPVIYRMVKGVNGTVSLDVTYQPRLDYARARTELRKDGLRITADGNGTSLTLSSTIPLDLRDEDAFATHEIKAGERIVFVLGHDNSLSYAPETDDALEATTRAWKTWVHSCDESVCVFGGPWHEMVVRSAFTLKILTHQATGSIAAAATTSLPDEIGGVRNWDYRFTWLRDASFTVQALHNLGHRKGAENFLDWFQEIIARHPDPSEIQIMYGLYGTAELKEIELDHLEGYKNSSPVRIGNGAALQRQLDIYGEVMDAAYQLTRYGGTIEASRWPLIRTLADYVCSAWKKRDAGIWEVRGGDTHFVYSKVMCWVALDRAAKLCDQMGLEEDVQRWSSEAEAIRTAVLEQGYNEELGAFVQSFGSDILDASNLLIPLVGFLPADDPRVQGTIDATIRDLSDGPFVQRYKADDGLPGEEGAFLLCSFWLVDCLTLSGRVDEATEIFTRLMGLANHVGLFAEEVDPASGDFLGNFPQAFTHIGFINSALYLGKAAGRQQIGPSPMGTLGA